MNVLAAPSHGLRSCGGMGTKFANFYDADCELQRVTAAFLLLSGQDMP